MSFDYKDYLDEDELQEWEEYEDTNNQCYTTTSYIHSPQFNDETYYEYAVYFIGCSDDIFEDEFVSVSDELSEAMDDLKEDITQTFADRYASEEMSKIDDALPPGMWTVSTGINCRIDIPSISDSVIERIISDNLLTNEELTEIYEGVLSDYAAEIDDINKRIQEEKAGKAGD